MAKFYNKETYLKELAEKGMAMPLNLYRGGKDDNLSAKESTKLDFIKNKVVKMSQNWEQTEGYLKLQNEVNEFVAKYKNTANTPSQEEIDELFAKYMIDITKRYMEKGDLTALIATELTNEAFPENVSLKEFLKYRGNFKEVQLNGDDVPLIQQATGSVNVVTMKAYGLGFAQTLHNLIYNQFYTVAKVNEAVSDAYIDKRNSMTIGKIVATSYGTAQTVAADTTSGATSDVLLYNTLDSAEDALRALKNPQTKRPINVPSVSLLINSRDAKRIKRVIGGQLNAFGKTAGRNVPPLDAVTNIIEYDQGITDGFKVGKETMSFPGVTKGEAYMFVPREYFWILNKRGLTMETSEGSALSLSQQESAWYFIQTQYDDEFFGSSQSGTSLDDGYGAIVKITLPA